jgi:ribosome maturation protein SDO1
LKLLVIKIKLKTFVKKCKIQTKFYSEKDLSEVLQIEKVFTNVAKGQYAKKEDLKECFGTEDENKIILEILEKGELQVSQKEREELNAQYFKDIVNIVVNMCINPDTKRPYTFGLLERTMKEHQFTFKTTKNTKSQALEAITKLKKIMSIERAKMRLNLILTKDKFKKLKSDLKDKEVIYEKESFEDNNMNVIILVGKF